MRPTGSRSSTLRRWARAIHRDLSYLFAGVVIVYAVSGIALNHKRDFNSSYSVERIELQLPGDYPLAEPVDEATARRLLAAADPKARYVKHYAAARERIKIFIVGGSTLEADLATGQALYEKLTRRPILGSLNRLHYNPGRWWTRFSDLFAAALLVITLTGLVMVPGRNGMRGRGGIEVLIGIAIPILFLLLL